MDIMSAYASLRAMLRDTALFTGEKFLAAAVGALARHLDTDFVFVTQALDDAVGNVRVLAAWRDGQEIDGWEFALPGTPCELIYDRRSTEPWSGMRIGGSIAIAEDVCRQFAPARHTAYEAFIGVPLWGDDCRMIGHLALFFERRLTDGEERRFLIEVAELFSLKLQAELIRMSFERERDNLIEGLKQANEQLAQESITDSLTRLFNRRYFTQRIQQEFARYKRSRDLFALLLLDLDHFKDVNDCFGHDVGDRLLCEVARAYLALTRSDVEVVFRIGGDEFAIICPGTMNPQMLQDLGGRINRGVGSLAFVAHRHEIPVSVSIGAALPTEQDASWDVIYVHADSALYAAKAQGRDRTVVFGH